MSPPPSRPWQPPSAAAAAARPSYCLGTVAIVSLARAAPQPPLPRLLYTFGKSLLATKVLTHSKFDAYLFLKER